MVSKKSRMDHARLMKSLNTGVPVDTTPTNGQKVDFRHQATHPDIAYDNFPSPYDWRH